MMQNALLPAPLFKRFWKLALSDVTWGLEISPSSVTTPPARCLCLLSKHVSARSLKPDFWPKAKFAVFWSSVDFVDKLSRKAAPV